MKFFPIVFIVYFIFRILLVSLFLVLFLALRVRILQVVRI